MTADLTWFTKFSADTETDVHWAEAMGPVEMSKIDTEIVNQYGPDINVTAVGRRNRSGARTILFDRQPSYSNWVTSIAPGPTVSEPSVTWVPAVSGSRDGTPIVTRPIRRVAPSASMPIIVAIGIAAAGGLAWAAGAFE